MCQVQRLLDYLYSKPHIVIKLYKLLYGVFFMAREWREEHKGGIYHVIAGVNNKEYIFKESIEKGYFINC